jgi:hypothetical protein
MAQMLAHKVTLLLKLRYDAEAARPDLESASQSNPQSYFKAVHSVRFVDQFIQFIVQTKCTLLVTHEC